MRRIILPVALRIAQRCGGKKSAGRVADPATILKESLNGKSRVGWLMLKGSGELLPYPTWMQELVFEVAQFFEVAQEGVTSTSLGRSGTP